jgi:homoserine kinase
VTPFTATVHVPASTSNLGSGFDCVGMAVDRWLSASATLIAPDNGVAITRRGTLATLSCAPHHDLLYEGFAAACASRNHELPTDIAFDVTSTIPVARGLGSSAAALVAGAALADALLPLHLGAHGIATLVSQIEGHPDNAAPSVFGGAMLGVSRDDATEHARCTYAFSPLAVHADLAFVFAVPSLEVTTASARAVLPMSVPFNTAVRVVQRSAALIHGLGTGDPDLLARALDDVLHVPWRRSLVPGYDDVCAAAIAAGAFGATLSGSGSAMLAIGRRSVAAEIATAMRNAFAVNYLQAETLVTAGVVPGLRSEHSDDR